MAEVIVPPVRKPLLAIIAANPQIVVVRKLLRLPRAVFGIAVIALVLFCAVFADHIAPYDPEEMDFGNLLSGITATAAPPVATRAAASEPRGVFLTSILSAMPRRGKRFSVSQMPLVLAGTATILAVSRICLKASTLLTSGFGAPDRTATPRPTCASGAKK